MHRLIATMRECARGMLVLLVVAWAALPAHAQERTLEYAVKAAFLYKLGPFVDWPAAAFPAVDSPVNLCLVGGDPFGAVIDGAVAGQRIGARPIIVVRARAVASNTGCHILYIASDDPRVTAEVVRALRGAPVLTVTDGIREPEAKGIINFVLRDNRVRFEIDDQAASENGLDISSKVLSLAVAVRPRS